MDKDDVAYGFRLDTNRYSYFLRCYAIRLERNFYCHCYVKELLDQHIENYKQDTQVEDKLFNNGNFLFKKLLAHRGHKINISAYGSWNNPEDACLECEDCNEVILDSDTYDLYSRKDF